jgi:hypothetical protein
MSTILIRSVLVTFLLITISAQLSVAQQTLRGQISDAKTGEALEAATVQITGTYRGTISNSEGEFELQIPAFPTELSIRFIGYTSQIVQLSEMPDFLEVKLQPIAVDLREVVVTGEDPAIGIMREVIRRKQIWRDQLDSFQAEAYSRQRLQNDTGIVTITESLSQVYWDKKRGTREVITSRTQTSNIDATQNFASATNLPNFYDDDISISGFDLVGVTHLRALDFYHFKLEGFRQLDDKTVFDISVRPKRRLQPTFEGMIAVLDEDYALIEVDLRPGESVMFPPPIQEFGLAYEQQFLNFGGDFWLPVDVRIDGTIRFGFPGLQFPTINFTQLSRITNYEVNTTVPDSLFRVDRRIVVDTLSVASSGSKAKIDLMRVPLDEREQIAYETVDSTQTLEKAFQPTGALARFIETEDEEEREPGPLSRLFGSTFDGVSPVLGYNRVDEGQLGLKYDVPLKGIWRPSLSAVYSTGNRDWDYEIESTFRLKNRYLREVSVGYARSTAQTFDQSMFDPYMISLNTLLAAPDYFDYFKSTGFNGEIVINPRISEFEIKLSGGVIDVESMTKVTNYSIPGGYIQRENVSINDGTDSYAGIELRYGDDEVPFGVVGTQSISLSLRQGLSVLDGDFDYTRLHSEVNWRFNTFYKRRFMPNTLDIKLVVGTSFGELPRHVWHGLDSNLGYFGPFGAFKTLGSLPVQSTSLAAVHWEHNFRTIPFEALGLMSVAKKGIGIIVHGSHGVIETNGLNVMPLSSRTVFDGGEHHEIGMAVNGLFGLFRFDASKQINGSGYFLGFSVARLF